MSEKIYVPLPLFTGLVDPVTITEPLHFLPCYPHMWPFTLSCMFSILLQQLPLTSLFFFFLVSSLTLSLTHSLAPGTGPLSQSSKLQAQGYFKAHNSDHVSPFYV